MAPMLTLFCLVIDNQKVPIGNAFKIQIRSDRDTSDLRKVIKDEMAPRLNHLAASELNILKLSTDPPINTASKNIFDEIKAIDFSSTNVQGLPSAEELFQHWENSPDRRHLHIIVQVPSVNTPESIKIDLVRGTADRLYCTLWKKPLNPILAPVVVPDPKKTYMYVPQDQLSKLGVKHLDYEEEALLFRDEYILAHKAIKEWSKKRRTEKSGGVVITGHPGLGKTCFLLYLLFHRLSKGLPTAFQFLPDSFVLFTNSGVKVYAHTFDELPDGTWALADCSAKDPLPCDSFLVACRSRDAFIVQTSFPDEKRYKTWRKEYKAYTYVMDCFSLTESVALGMIHGFNDQLIKDHCEKWGPSARIMMTLLKKPGLIPEHTRCVKEAARHFIHHFGVHTHNINPSPLSHTLFTIHPKGLTSEYRPIAIMRIETSYLNRFVIEAIAAQDLLQQSKFYFGVSHHSSFKGSAGYMFDMAVLSWLCANSESKELACTPARSGSPQLTIPVCQGWCMLSYKDQHTLKYLSDCKRPFCVIPIPVSKALPAVDAMIFTDDHIITIQVTIAPEYSVKSKGLLQIANSLAKGFRQSRKWCHVFVTDRAENAESLLRKWTKKDVKIKEYDIFISIYSAVLDGKDFCQIKDEEKWKESRVMKDIEIFEEDETAEVVEEAENSEMDED